LPVCIEKLGAHVEAFVNTLPTITALRLCHKFGSGSRCSIRKLPVELIDAIEEFIIEPARERALDVWTKDYQCWQLKCDILDDHFTYEEQHDLYHNRHRYYTDHEREKQECLAGNCLFSQDMDADMAAEARAKAVGCVQLDWGHRHDENNQLWDAKASSIASSSIFKKHRALLERHFGIDIWTSHVRLQPPEPNKWNSDEGRNATMAYLTLPHQATLQPNGARYAWRAHISNTQCGHAMPVTLAAAPTPKSLERFPRALKLLGLEVFVETWEHTDVESSDVVDAGPELADCWPQLTVLTRHVVDVDE
jgi:hypothetical protein